MGIRKKKSDASQNQAWLDWLNDDAPSESSSPGTAQSASPSFGAPKSTGSPRRPGAGLDGFAPRPGATTGGFPRSQQPTFTSPKPKVAANTEPRKPVPPALSWRSAPPTVAAKSKKTDEGDIAINIHLPQFKLPKLKKVTPNWRYMRWAAIAVVVLGLLVGGNAWLHRSNEVAKLAKQSGTEQPTYAPLKPSESDEGAVESSAVYNAKQQLYKYNDTYLGSALTVSQQPLPDDIKANPDKLAKIAESSIGATDSFDTANGKVYIATSEGGYQRLVLVHRQLLLFITSPKELEITDWVTYVQALE